MTHNKSTARIYDIWRAMKQRCYYKKNVCYKDYGGRGITVCEEWLHNFQAFYDWAMANGYEENLTIDRKDVNGNYEPSNCRWATNAEQATNKRNSRYIKYRGELKTLSEWSKVTGIDQKTISYRIEKGYPMDKVFSRKDLRNESKNRKIGIK